MADDDASDGEGDQEDASDGEGSDEEEDQEDYPGASQLVLNFQATFDSSVRIQLIATRGSVFDCIMSYHSST